MSNSARVCPSVRGPATARAAPGYARDELQQCSTAGRTSRPTARAATSSWLISVEERADLARARARAHRAPSGTPRPAPGAIEVDTDVPHRWRRPTGLMLANQWCVAACACADRPPRGPAQQDARARGSGAHLGTQLGCISPRARSSSQRHGCQHLAGATWGGCRSAAPARRATPYPYIYSSARTTTSASGERLREQGAAVTWSTSWACRRESVTARLKDPDGTVRECTAAWLPVRRRPHRGAHLAASVSRLRTSRHLRRRRARRPAAWCRLGQRYLWREGFHLLFPMRGTDHWRISWIVPEPLRARRLTRVRGRGAVGAARAGDWAFRGAAWFSIYRIHYRAAVHSAPGAPSCWGMPPRSQPGGGAGHDTGVAGCLQPRLEAGAGGGTARYPRTRRCLTPTRRRRLLVAQRLLHYRPGLFGP